MPVRPLTVKEKALLHLFDHNRFQDEYEVPLEVTQKGIAEAVGIRVTHVPQYVKPLMKEGKVEERTSHIRRHPRRRKVYFLTVQGRQEVASQRNYLLGETIPFKVRSGEVEEVPFSRVYQEDRRGTPLLALLRELDTVGYVAEVVEPTEAELVDYAQEAPTVERFYGRVQELEEIAQALEGTPVVVVTGMAGVGKTTLGSKTCDLFRDRRSLFWRQIRSWDTALDIATSLATFLKSLGRTALHATLTRPGPRELTRVEELLTGDLAGVEALLVLDDAHDASEDAQAMLEVLVRVLKHHKRTSLLLLARTAPAVYSRREVVVEESVAEVPLRGLDPQSCASLLEDAGISGPLVEELTQISGGIPLFLKLLASGGPTAPPAEGWSSLQMYIAEEIEPALDAGEQACLQCASFYEVSVPQEGLLLEEEVSGRTLVSLQKRGLLDLREGDRLLLHASLKEYFQRGISRERKGALVARIVPWLQQEADRVGQEGRPYDAISYLENALNIDEDAERRSQSLEKLAESRHRTGAYPAALRALKAAMELAEKPEVLVHLHERACISYETSGDLDAAEKEIEAGLALLPPEPSLPAARLVSERATIHYHRQEFDEAMEDLNRVTEWLPVLPEDLDLKEGLTHLRALIYRDDPNRVDLALSQAEFEATMELAGALGDKFGIATIHTDLALMALERGQSEEAGRHIEESLAIAEEVGALAIRRVGLLLKAWYLLECQGDAETAEALYQETYQMLKEAHMDFIMPWHHRHFADLYRRQDRVEEARESLAYFLTAGGDLLTPETRIENLCLMVRLCVLTEDIESGAEHLEEARSLAGDLSTDLANHALTWAEAALSYGKGENEKARRRFDRAYASLPRSLGRSRTIAQYLASLAYNGEFLLEYGMFLVTTEELDPGRDILEEAGEEFSRRCLNPLARVATRALSSAESPA